MPESPWEQVSAAAGFFFRSTRNPDYELHRGHDTGYTLINTRTGWSQTITDHGRHYALDVAEGIVAGGVEGTHERNICRGLEQ